MNFGRKHSYRLAASWAAIFCACCACTAAIAQEVYKSTDAQGRTIYSDRPLTRDAERITATDQPRNAPAGQTSEAQTPGSQRLAAPNQMLAERTARIAEGEAAAAKKAEEDQQRAAQCAKARTQYYRFADGRPQFHLNDAGERVAYSYGELDALRQSTQRQMEQACAGQ